MQSCLLICEKETSNTKSKQRGCSQSASISYRPLTPLCRSTDSRIEEAQWAFNRLVEGCGLFELVIVTWNCSLNTILIEFSLNSINSHVCCPEAYLCSTALLALLSSSQECLRGLAQSLVIHSPNLQNCELYEDHLLVWLVRKSWAHSGIPQYLLPPNHLLNYCQLTFSYEKGVKTQKSGKF